MNRGPFRFMWIFISTLCFFLHFNSSEGMSKGVIYTCLDKMKVMIKGSAFGKIGVELMKRTENSGEGFVYSEWKMVDKLFTFVNIGSKTAIKDIVTFLGLQDATMCTENEYCFALNMLNKEINDRQNTEYVEFRSFIYHEFGNSAGRVGLCTYPIELDDKATGASILLEVNNKLKENYTSPSYFTGSLDPRTNLFHVGVLKMKPSVYGDIQAVSSSKEFQHFDGTRGSIKWVKMQGQFWFGSTNLKSDDTTCRRLKLIGSEINGGKLHMFYFIPVFHSSVTVAQKSECFQYIFSNLKEYITLTRNEETDTDYGAWTSTSLLVPMMDLATDTDLKPILQTDLPNLFKQDQITGLHFQTDSLYDLRTWEGISNKPENYNGVTGHDSETEDVIFSPFVFAVVDKATQMVLKTGAMLRPT